MSLDWLIVLLPLALAVFAWRSFSARFGLLILAASVTACVAMLYATHVKRLSEVSPETEIATDQVLRATMRKARSDLGPSGPEFTLAGTHLAIRVDEAIFRQLETLWDEPIETEESITLNWPSSRESARFMVVPTTVRNPLKAGRKGNGYPEVSDADVARFCLHRYPMSGETDSNPLAWEMIMGPGANPLAGRAEAEYLLRVMNSTRQETNRFQAWILLFPGQPERAGELQEALWKGGATNDFVLCIGLDANDNVTWSRAFDWSSDPAPRQQIARWTETGKPLNLVALVDDLGSLRSSWVPPRRVSVWTVDRPAEDLIITAVVTLGVCVIIFFIAFDNGDAC